MRQLIINQNRKTMELEVKEKENQTRPEMDVNREMLEKDNSFTKKGHGETNLKKKEAVVGEEPGLKYKITKKSKVVEDNEDQERKGEE